MPDWLFEYVNPWTTPAAIVAATVVLAWVLRVRGRNLAVVALSAAVGVAMWQAWKSGPPNGLLDLQIYTNSARAWLDGGSLYDYRDPTFNLSATYPPIGPLLFSVLTPLTADGREVLFTAFTLLTLFGCAWFISGLARITPAKRFEWSAWAFAAAAVTIPVWLTLRQGQINALIWLLVLADLDALRRNRRFAGIAIGFATAIKLLPGLFIVWLAMTKRWVAALCSIVALGFAIGVGWLLAPSDSRSYWTDLLWHSDRVGALNDARNNSALGVIARNFEPSVGRTALWLCVSAAILVVALLRSVKASRANDFLAVAATVGCATAAISPISWTHHLGFLLVALAAFALQAKTTRSRLLCAGVWLFLIDPAGHGDDAIFSTIRALLVVGAVCFTPIRAAEALVEASVGQPETTPRTRETNSMLPP
ncbi:MAG: glycosyltransferase 87 family protein [Actinomycetota bacterium]